MHKVQEVLPPKGARKNAESRKQNRAKFKECNRSFSGYMAHKFQARCCTCKVAKAIKIDHKASGLERLVGLQASSFKLGGHKRLVNQLNTPPGRQSRDSLIILVDTQHFPVMHNELGGPRPRPIKIKIINSLA